MQATTTTAATPTSLLTLSRRPGESIEISGPAVITLQRYQGNRAILSIAASRDVRILRSELLGRIVDRAIGNAGPAAELGELPPPLDCEA